MIEISRAHFPVTTLGPGRRIGIWFQGCSIGCAECVSRDTWVRDSSKAIAVTTVLNWCKSVTPDGPDGVTISGGEPFDQPDGLFKLLNGLATWREKLNTRFDFLCYSGYRYKRLVAEHSTILSKLDGLIPEPFLANRSPGQRWRGSTNQPLIPLSALGDTIYRRHIAEGPNDEFQIVTQNRQIWLIGIPSRGKMDKFSEACAQRGLVLKSVSWTP